MTDEKWKGLVEQAEKNFRDFTYNIEDILVEVREGYQKEGVRETLEFTNDGGTFKIVREVKPRYRGKNTFHHKKDDPILSEKDPVENETSSQIRFFKADDIGDLQEIDSRYLNLD